MAPLRLLGAFLLGIGLVAGGYAGGSAGLFYGGLLLLAAAAGAVAFRGGPAHRRGGVRIAGLCAAVSIGLLLAAELGVRGLEWARARESAAAPPARSGSVEGVRRAAQALADFWNPHLESMTTAPFAMPDPTGANPYVLRPGSLSRALDSEIRIDSQGFRGPEISIEKSDRFRVVALGESTTFGVTIEASDRPWPEVLEARIADELSCDAPVEVINAGVPGWTLANQIARLPADVLPLRPDLILSYHGYDGFWWFFPSVPELRFLPEPRVPPRPSRLLEQAEKAIRFWDLRRRYEPAPDPAVALRANSTQTEYANLYRQLARLARSHGAALALLSFNLAVNEHSPEVAVESYARAFPAVRHAIVANHLHTRLLRELGGRAGVHFVDTGPGLDGESDLYLDLVHLTQAGRERLAANALEGLLDLLEAHPRLHCRPRA